MIDELPIKRCRVCQRDKPLHDDYWHRDIHSPDGYRHACAQCRNEKATYEKEQIVDDVFASLEKKGIEHLATLAEGGSQLPHMAEVYESIMDGFGGPRLFAQHLIACYFHPQTSQHIKAKLLQSVIGLSVKVSDSGLIARDLDGVPTEELQRMLEDRMRKAVNEHVQRLKLAETPDRAPGVDLPAIPPPPTVEGRHAG